MVVTVTKQMKVRLWRQGLHFKVDPACPEVLYTLRTVRHIPVADRQHGYGVQRLGLPMFMERDDVGRKVMSMPAGLETLVKQMLVDAGYQVMTIDEWEHQDGGRAEWLLAPSGGRLGDTSLLKAVQAHDRFLVRYRLGRVHPDNLISQLAHAWPAKKIFVAATRHRDVLSLARHLQIDLPATGAITCKHHLANAGQVTVGTYQSLAGAYQAHGGTELEWIDLIVMLDAQEALGTAGITCLKKCYRARLVGLLPLGTELSPGEQDELAAVYGFEQVVIPRHGHHSRQVEVSFVPVQGGPALGSDIDLFRLKRAGLWRHPVRNRQIAKVARSGSGLTDPGRSPSRIVLVENVEQALALSRLLPTWPILTGDEVHTAGLSPVDQEVLSEYRVQEGVCDRVIVTAQGVQKIKLADVDIVIRADGGTGLPALNLNHLIERNQQAPRPLRLMDFVDLHHPDLQQRSRQRQQAYLDQEWFEAGVDAVEERMRRFLKSRQVKSNQQQAVNGRA